MRRSRINYVTDKVHTIAQTFRVCLPGFVYFTVGDWLQRGRDSWQEVVDLQLGWGITDFGRGNLNQTGLTLLMVRNDAPGSAAHPEPYAEKMLRIQQDQWTPWHFHTHRAEDIFNRGSGDLCMRLVQANEASLCGDQRAITVNTDGQRHIMKPGKTLVLRPRQDICLPSRLYHRFWAEKVSALGWEISMVNDG